MLSHEEPSPHRRETGVPFSIDEGIELLSEDKPDPAQLVIKFAMEEEDE
jgi:hypothetical protein